MLTLKPEIGANGAHGGRAVLLVEVELNLELVSATIHHQQMEVQIVSVVQADHNLATHKTVQRVRQVFDKFSTSTQ